MKRIHFRRFFAFWALLFVTIVAAAQNTLNISALQGTAGKTVTLPIALNNSDEIVAVQFTLQLPFALATDVEPAISDGRSQGGHSIGINHIGGGRYTVLITNLTGKAIPGNGGTLAEIPMKVGNTAQPGETYPIKITDIVLADKTGKNVCSRPTAPDAIFTIQREASPDLECSAVGTEQQKVLPGQELTMNWTVKNIGDVATGGGWKENISLVSSRTGYSLHLGTTYFADALPAHGSIVRNETIVVPQILAMDVDAYLRVSIEPGSGVGEYLTDRANNTATSTEAYPVGQAIFLASPLSTLTEGETVARLTLTRSGDRTFEENITLTQSVAGVLDMPAQVTFPAGQSSTAFDVKALDNDEVNDYESVEITAKSSQGLAASLKLDIVDEDALPMTITTDKTEYNEGETIRGTITVPRRIGTEDLVVFLGIEQEKRFRLPLAVVFDDGATTAEFEIPVLQDNVPANTLSIELTATADRYEKATMLFVLEDDDVPAITMTLNTTSISEGAGPQALFATITRTDVTSSVVTVNLTDDAGGELYHSESITLDEGVTEKIVAIGVVDNSIVDGEREVTLTAEVYISSCSCNVVGSKQTTVEQKITLLDNDGPTLNLVADKTSILEGDATGTTITLSRNTSSASALIVNLSANRGGLTFPAQVTIPAGKNSTTFVLAAQSNDKQEGNYVVNVTAEASGFGKGAAWVMVSDQTLPDMELTSLTLSQTEVVAGDEYSVIVSVTNVGAAPAPERSKVSVEAAGQNITLTIGEAIAVGETKEITATFTAPTVPGTYAVTATANNSLAFEELQLLNNQSTLPLTVSSCYTLDIAADKATYNQGATVILTGTASSLRGNVEGLTIEPYIIYYGARTRLSSTVAADGTFVATYQLPEGMGGEYGFGVCIPGENSTEVMASASVYGIARKSASYIKAYHHPGEPIEIPVTLMNLSSLPVHNVKASFTDESGHVTMTCPAISEVGPNGEAQLLITSTSSAITTTQDWERVKVNLTTDEGASLSFPIYTFTSSPTPILSLSTTQITSSISKGKVRTFPVVVSNLGVGETGKITVDIPKGQKFVSLASTAEIPSLAYGESATVMLQFDPTGLDVNLVQRGSVAFNCDKGDGQLLYFNLKTVSEEKGNLLVRVEDENTIYGNAAGEHPYVNGATVVVKDYNTGAVLYSETTGKAGFVEFKDVDEGAYIVHVTAPKHDSYTQSVIVAPGETTEHLASVSYQAISVSWDVVETTTEDKYEVTTELVYETRVPVPVVTCTFPEVLDLETVRDGNDMLFNIVLRNEGLITAQNVEVTIPQHEGFEFTPLAEFSGFELAPEQSRVIPVYVSYAGSTPAHVQARYAASPRKEVTYTCSDKVMLGWEWVCKESSHAWLEKPIQWLLRECTPHGTPDTPPQVNRDKPEPIEPKDPGPVEDPQPRYGRVNSQVDLLGIYDLVCKVFCTMACCAPDIPSCKPPKWESLVAGEAGQCALKKKKLASSATNGKKPRKGCLSLEGLKCALTAASKDYKKAPARVLTLYDRVFAGYELYADLLDLNYNFALQMTGAPALLDDVTMTDLVLPCLADVNWLMDKYHQDGVLYIMSHKELYDALIEFMPMKRGTWVDFNFDDYIDRRVNTFRQQDGLDFDSENVILASDIQRLNEMSDELKCRLVDMGFASWDQLAASLEAGALELYNPDAGTCATVKLEIKQELVLTRQAFRGTMVIDNSSDTELTDIDALITATDERGNLATSHEMQITRESIEGFTADGDKLKLPAGSKGTITYLFIPTRYAATENDVRYSFGGTLYFNDGNDLQARSLYPVTLTVRPTPELDLAYFVQSDVYGDNPLTPDVIEPVIPAEFTVLIHNVGKGEAANVRMLTHQPEITENEKGELINFAIVSSSLNGEPKSMALRDDIATDFGNIPAGATSYASWGLTCDLLGHFVDYDVAYTHVTSYDNPDLSVLNPPTIHKLVHSVNAHVGDKVYRAWVTDDFVDAQNEPDHIYFANGLDERLETLTNVATIEPVDATHYRITVDVPIEEWFYLKVNNPVGRRAQIVSVIDEDSAAPLDLDNVWTTQYTLHKGKNPLEEYRIHLVDQSLSKGTRRYIVEFEPLPEKELEITITGVPEGDAIAERPIDHLTVSFNKPIAPATFTREDIILRREGQQIDAPLPITQIDDTTYEISTAALTDNGYYALQIAGTGITDTEGYQGFDGAQARWTLFQDGLVHYIIHTYPSRLFGQVSGAPSDGVTGADYGDQLHLLATAAKGATFAYWATLNRPLAVAAKVPARAGEMPPAETLSEKDFTLFSEDPSLTIDMVRDYNLYAVFRPNQYSISVDCDATAGSVNLVAGSYPYGETLHLVATPADDYLVDGFEVNGERVSSMDEFDFTVQSDAVVTVLFQSLAPTNVLLTENVDYIPQQIERANVVLLRSFVKGVWNTICLPCPVDNPEAVFGAGTKVARLERYENGFVKFDLVDRMLPNVPYLIQPGSMIDFISSDGNVRTTTYPLGLTAIYELDSKQPADYSGDLSFIGTYDDQPLATESGNFILTDNVFRYVSADIEQTSHRFRAYFHVDDNFITELQFWQDSILTGMTSPAVGDVGETIYDIEGRKHTTNSHLQHGIYITPSRKLLVK